MDSSALYALLSSGDENHPAAAETFGGFATRSKMLVTHTYIVLEATALVQRRLGAIATRELHESLLAPIDLYVIEADVHRAAVTALLAAPRRNVSLVDWASFEVMRREGLEVAFAFDRDFVAQGFEIVP